MKKIKLKRYDEIIVPLQAIGKLIKKTGKPFISPYYSVIETNNKYVVVSGGKKYKFSKNRKFVRINPGNKYMIKCCGRQYYKNPYNKDRYSTPDYVSFIDFKDKIFYYEEGRVSIRMKLKDLIEKPLNDWSFIVEYFPPYKILNPQNIEKVIIRKDNPLFNELYVLKYRTDKKVITSNVYVDENMIIFVKIPYKQGIYNVIIENGYDGPDPLEPWDVNDVPKNVRLQHTTDFHDIPCDPLTVYTSQSTTAYRINEDTVIITDLFSYKVAKILEDGSIDYNKSVFINEDLLPIICSTKNYNEVQLLLST
jgi:hypothetical protein